MIRGDEFAVNPSGKSYCEGVGERKPVSGFDSTNILPELIIHISARPNTKRANILKSLLRIVFGSGSQNIVKDLANINCVGISSRILLSQEIFYHVCAQFVIEQ